MKLLNSYLYFIVLFSCSKQPTFENRLKQIQEIPIDDILYLMNKYKVDSIKAVFISGNYSSMVNNELAEFYYSQGDSVSMIDYMTYDWPRKTNIYKNGQLIKQVNDFFTKRSFNYYQKGNKIIRAEVRTGFKNQISYDTSEFKFRKGLLRAFKYRNLIHYKFEYNSENKTTTIRDSIISEKMLAQISDTVFSNNFFYNSKNILTSSVMEKAGSFTHTSYDSLGFPKEKYGVSDLDTIYHLRYSVFKSVSNKKS